MSARRTCQWGKSLRQHFQMPLEYLLFTGWRLVSRCKTPYTIFTPLDIFFLRKENMMPSWFVTRRLISGFSSSNKIRSISSVGYRTLSSLASNQNRNRRRDLFDFDSWENTSNVIGLLKEELSDSLFAYASEPSKIQIVNETNCGTVGSDVIPPPFVFSLC